MQNLYRSPAFAPPPRYHGPVPGTPFPADVLTQIWESIRHRFAAYEHALPGSASFICKTDLCNCFCCKSYTVNLGEPEVARFAASSGLPTPRFLETEGDEPIILPMAQPYVLRRENSRCAFLGDDLRCTQYHGRPDACRLYPYFILVIDREAARPVYADRDKIQGAVAAFARNDTAHPFLPILVQHSECPGFTGPPMSEADWHTLFETTYDLQYGSL